MNILVCFSVAPDLEMLITEDWVVTNHHQIDVSFLKQLLNSFDESALELALKIYDKALQLDIPISKSALTIGGPEATPILKTLLALNFDPVIRIDSKADLRFKAMRIASIISQYILKNKSCDVLMMGWQSVVGNNAKTPLLVSEMLKWPCLTQVTEIDLFDNTNLLITRNVDGGRVKQKINSPCVLSIGNVANSYLRIPTLKDRILTKNKKITVLNAKDFKSLDENIEILALEVINRRRSGLIIEGLTHKAKAKNLYYNYLKKRLDKIAF